MRPDSSVWALIEARGVAKKGGGRYRGDYEGQSMTASIWAFTCLTVIYRRTEA
jgi:hypothetical protein